MPNQYSTPQVRTPQGTYVSQHVGLPLEEIELMLQAKQGQYDATEAMGIAEKTRLGGITAVGEWAEGRLAEREKELEDFTKSFDGKDLGSGEVTKAFKQKVSDLAADKDLQNIQAFAGKYKEYNANREAMRKSGDYFEENDYHNQKALMRYSKTGDSNGFDTVIDKGVNIHHEAEEYFKALKPDDIEVMRSIADGQGGSVYYDNKSGGISSGKIMGQAGRVFHEFETSAAGKQAIRRYQMEMDRTGQKATGQGAQQYLAKILTNAGAGFQQTSISSGLSAAMNKKQDKEDKKKEAKEAMQLPWTTVATMAPHMPLNERGEIVGEGGMFETYEEITANGGDWKQGIKGAWDNLIGNRANPLSKEQVAKLAPVKKGFEEVNKMRVKSGASPYSLPEYMKAIEATSGVKKQITLNVQLNPTAQKGYNDLLVENRGILGMPMINTQNPNEVLTGEQVLRKVLGKDADDEITDEEIKGAVKVLAGTTDTDYALDGVGVNFQGPKGQGAYLGDMGMNKMMEGYQPTSIEEMQRITNFGMRQAKQKGGSHEYFGYHRQNGSVQRAKLRTVYNPLAKNEKDQFITTVVK